MPLNTKAVAFKIKVTHSNTQCIVTREARAAAKTTTTQAMQNFHASDFSEKIQGKTAHNFSRREAETVPDLPNKDGHFHWYNAIHPLKVLRDLLILARDKDTSSEITQADIKEIIALCNYDGRNFTVNKRKCTKIAIRILSYLAEHGWSLPKAAIAVLVSEIELGDKKTLNYAMLALGYVINNGHAELLPGNIRALLDNSIKKLIQFESLDYLETIAVCLSAKTKLGLPLSERDLEYLKQTLVEGDYSLYPSGHLRTPIKADLPKKPGISFFSMEFGELGTIKKTAQQKKLLSKDQLEYAVRRWHRNRDTRVRTRVLKIIRHAVLNGQRSFPEHDVAISVLEEALRDYEHKIRNNAIVATNCLLINGELHKHEKIISELHAALHYQRKYALNALSDHLRLLGEAKLSRHGLWVSILDHLKENEVNEIKNMASYLLFQFHGNVDTLKELLLDRDYCIKASEAYLVSARAKQEIPLAAIVNLTKILSDDFPFEVKFNSMLVLSLVAENKQVIPESTLIFVMKNYLSVDIDVGLRDNALRFVGNCASVYVQLMLSSKILQSTESIIEIPEHRENVVFLLASMIDALTEDVIIAPYQNNFIRLFDILGIQLTIPAVAENLKKNIIVLFGKSVKKELSLSNNVLESLAKVLSETVDASLRLKLIHIIGMALQKYSKISLSEHFVETIISMCQSEQDAEVCDASQVLRYYISISERTINSTLVSKIANLLTNFRCSLTICDVIKNMVEKGWKLPSEVICLISPELLNDFSEIQDQIADILDKLAVNHSLPEDSIKHIQEGLSSTNEEIVRSCISATNKIIKNKIYNGKFIDENCYLKLIAVANDFAFDLDTRVKAIEILVSLASEEGYVFSLEALNNFQPLLFGEYFNIRINCIKAIKLQIQYLGMYFSNNNPLVVELMHAIEKCLLDDNEEQQRECVIILGYARRRGYVIPTAIIERLAEMLYTITDNIARAFIIRILNERSSSLSRAVRKIVEIENYADCFYSKDKSIVEKETAIAHLLVLASKNVLMTVAVFIKIKNVIKDKQFVLFKSVLSICEIALRNRQTLPDALLVVLSEFILENPSYPEIISFANVMAMVAKRNHFVEHKIFYIIENLLCNAELALVNAILYNEAIAIAIVTGFTVQVKTIRKFFDLLLHMDPDQGVAIVDALAALLMDDNKSNLYKNEYGIEVLIKVLEVTKHVVFKQKIHNLISLLSKRVVFDKAVLHSLCSYVVVSEDFESQRDILRPLAGQAAKQDLPVDVKNLLKVKEMETNFLSKEVVFKEKEAHLLFLRGHAKLLSKDFFIALGEYLKKQDDELVLPILNFIYSIRSSVITTSFLLLPIVAFIKNSIHLELSESIIQYLLEMNQHVSVEVIDILSEVLISHETGSCRATAHRLLMGIKKFQDLKDSVEMLLQVEYTDEISEQLETVSEFIRKLQAHIENQGILTIGNAKALFNVLEKSPQFAGKIIGIFDRVKTHLPLSICCVLIRQFLAQIFLEKKKNQYIASLCCYLISAKSNTTENMALLDFAEKNILDGHSATHVELLVLENLAKHSKRPIHENVIIKLINIFFESEDPQLKLKIIAIVLDTVMHAKQLSLPLIADIKKFENVIVPSRDLLRYLFKTAPVDPVVQSSAINLFGYIYFTSDAIRETFTPLPYETLLKLVHQRPQSKIILSLLQKLDLKKRMNALLAFLSLDPSDDVESLQNCPIDLIVRQLFCIALLEESKEESKEERNTRFNIDETKFYHYLTLLEEQHYGQALYSEERDNFLRVLLHKKKQEKLSLIEINNLLAILRKFKDKPLPVLMTHENDLLSAWLRSLLDSLPCCKELTETQISQVKKSVTLLKWDIDLIECFFECLPEQTTFLSIQEFFDFLYNYNISMEKVSNLFRNIELRKFSINEIKKFFIAELLSEQVDVLSQKIYVESSNRSDESSKLYRKKTLLSRVLLLENLGWSFEKLLQLFKKINEVSHYKYGQMDIQQLFVSIDIVYHYQIPEKVFYELYNTKDAFELPTALHEYVIAHSFSAGSQPKSLPVLLTEMQSLKINQSNTKLMKLLTHKEVHHLETNVTQLFTTKKKLPSKFNMIDHQPIEQWNKVMIQEWSSHIQSLNLSYDALVNNDELLREILAVIKRACLIYNKPESSTDPRIVQLLSVWLLLRGQRNQGLFAQIATGEGKSLIIAILAVIKALGGETVDIVTSSPLLAERDARKFTGFYELFNLTVASNENSNYKTGIKECYKNDIVYGDANNFQFDILRHEYSELGTRGKRGFGSVIVDEVDNLLIDEGSKIAMLANPMPGMDHLFPLMILIWHQLKNLDICANHPERLLPNQGNPFNPMPQSNKDCTDIMIKSLMSYARKIMSGELNCSIKIPIHLKSFVDHQLQKWIESAIAGFYLYKEGHHYKIDRNNHGVESIMPVDFANTGVIQSGTSWSDGLQQFLQIKHGLTMTSEHLTTNFLSNISFIKRYGKKLMGITGTLGSVESQKLLNEIYGVAVMQMPTFLTRQLVQLPAVIASGDKEWLNEVANSAMREAKQGRVSAVICETINNAKDLRDILSKRFKGRIIFYADNQHEQDQFLKRELDGNTIIVTTNLTGRGADILLTNQVVKKGGLHVCMPFLPVNLRVEEQAFGRAARRGECGTAQLILNLNQVQQKLSLVVAEDFLQKTSADVTVITAMRDKVEALHIDHIRQRDLLSIINKDALFEKFLKLLAKIKRIDLENNAYHTVLASFGIEPSSLLGQFFREDGVQFNREALEERWGLWLKECDIDTHPEQALAAFDEFEENILRDYRADSIIQNPIYFIRLGNRLLERSNSFKHLPFYKSWCESAIRAYDRAIELDKNFSYNARYHKAYALIRIARHDYKNQAKELLVQMQDSIVNGSLQQEQAVLQCLTQQESLPTEYTSTALVNQLQNRLQVYQMLLGSASDAIEHIAESQKLIDVIVPTSIEETFTFCRLEQSQAIAAVSHSATDNLSVVFHHLKTNSDVWKSYQLKNTLEKLPDNVTMSITFDSGRLALRGEVKDELKKLLPINRNKETTAQKKKEEEQQQVQKERRLLGTREHLEYASSYIGAGARKVANKLGKAAKVVSTKIGAAYDQSVDWVCNYKEAESTPVAVTVRTLNYSTAIALLQQYDGGSLEDIDLIIYKFDESLRTLLEKSIYAADIHFHKNKIQVGCVESIQTVNKQTGISEQVEIQIRHASKEKILGILELVESACKENTLQHSVCESSMSLGIHNLTQHQAEKVIDLSTGSVQLCFEKLKKVQAKHVIELTASQHNQATLTVSNISKVQAQEIIMSADRSEQDLSINHKSIDAELLKMSDSKQSMLDYKRQGYFYLYHVDEKNPMPWKSICILSVLAVAQAIGGISLTALTFGFAANFGTSLVAESLCDIIRIATALYSREFDWSSYAWQKSLSMSMSLAFAGYASYTTTAQGAASSTQTAANGMLDYADEIAITAYKVTKSEAFKTACKEAAIRGGEVVASEAVSMSLDATKTGVMSHLKPTITSSMQHEVKIMFANGYWRQVLHRVFAMDKFLSDETNQIDLLSKASNFIKSMNFCLPGASVFDLETLDKFQKEFTGILKELDEKVRRFDDVLHNKFPHLGIDDINAIHAWLKDNKILNSDGTINICVLREFRKDGEAVITKEFEFNPDDYNVKNYAIDKIRCRNEGIEPYKKEEVIAACLDYERILRNDYFCERSDLSQKVASLFSDQMMSAIDSLVSLAKRGLSGLANLGIRKGFKKLSDNLSHSNQTPSENDVRTAESERVLDDTSREVTPDVLEVIERETSTLETGRVHATHLALLSTSIDRPVEVYDGEVRQLHANSKSCGASIKLQVGDFDKQGKISLKVLAAKAGLSREELTSTMTNHLKNTPLRQISFLTKRVVKEIKDQTLPGTHGVKEHIIPGQGHIAPSHRTLHHTHGHSRRLLSVERSSGEGKVEALMKHKDSRSTILTQELDHLHKHVHSHQRAEGLTKVKSLVLGNHLSYGIIDASFKTLQVTLLEDYRRKLTIYKAKATALMMNEHIADHRKTKEIYNILLREKYKIIKILLSLLIIEIQQEGKVMGSDDKANVKEVTEKAHKIYLECIRKRAQNDEARLQRAFEQQGLSLKLCKKGGSVITLLKEAIAGHDQLNKEKHMLTTKLKETVQEFDINSMGTQLVELFREGNLSEGGKLLKNGSLSEKGYLYGSVIEKIGSTVQGLVEAHKMSVMARARVQCMIVTLAEKTIAEQHGLQRQVMEIEREHQQLAAVIAGKQGKISEEIAAFENKILDEIIKVMGMEDAARADRYVGVLEKSAERFSTNMRAVSADMTEVAKYHAIDPGFVIKCGEQCASVVKEMLATVKALGAQNESELGNLTDRAFGAINRLTGGGKGESEESDKKEKGDSTATMLAGVSGAAATPALEPPANSGGASLDSSLPRRPAANADGVTPGVASVRLA